MVERIHGHLGQLQVLFNGESLLNEGVGFWSPDGEWLVLRTGGTGGVVGGRHILALRPGVDSVPECSDGEDLGLQLDSSDSRDSVIRGVCLITDGASRRNPGPGGIGYMITDDSGTVLAQDARRIGTATNNEAEYRPLIVGLEEAATFTDGHVTWISDADLIVQQMKGEYRVQKEHLRLLYERADELSTMFASFTPEHRPRTDPAISKVDKAINRALNEC